MIALEIILDGVLPIGVELIAAATAIAKLGEIIIAPALRQRPQPIGQRRCIAGQVDEQQPGPGVEPHGLQPQRLLVELGTIVDVLAADMGRAHQPPIQIIGPGMIGAGERRTAACGLAQEQRIAVAADIVEGLDLAAAVAQQKHRLAGDLDGPDIARTRQLRRAAGIDPARREEELLFQRQELGVGISRGRQAGGLAGRSHDGLDGAGRQEGLDAHGIPRSYAHELLSSGGQAADTVHQAIHEGLALGDLVDLDELVGLMGLADAAGPADNGGDAGFLIEAAFGAEGDLPHGISPGQ